MLVFEKACATEMAQAFRQRVLVVKDFIPDVSADIRAAVGDWTGESRQACDGALKRLEKRGEELADVLTGQLRRWRRSWRRVSMLSLKRLRASTVKDWRS